MPDTPDLPVLPTTPREGRRLSVVEDRDPAPEPDEAAPPAESAAGELALLLAQGGLSAVPPDGPCSSYTKGHVTHYIMARKYSTKGQPGTVVGFEEDKVVVRTAGGETFRWWHHEPLRLRASIASHGRAVTVIPELPALIVSGWFYCSDEPSPCYPPRDVLT